MTEINSNIMNLSTYNSIVEFIHSYKGLPIDCELELKTIFSNIDHLTLKSILQVECTQKTKSIYHKFASKSQKLLLEYEKLSEKDPYDFYILIKMAKNYEVPPSLMCRLIINEKYSNEMTKVKITELIKNPHLIPDTCLGGNARICVFSDNQEGPIPDFIRRCLGEEYELKTKQMATEAGLIFVDEENLRRIGFDKTPDLKLALPCLYKGSVVNWIESKALFGDIRTHKRYLQQQLTSYLNRFGPGIVIYWFGFIENILQLKENGGLIILNKFPESTDLELLKI